MTANIILNKPNDMKGRLRKIGGSQSDSFNNVLANQAAQTLWTANSTPDECEKQQIALIQGMSGVSPQDECEGILTAQLLASHNAAMECYRRAMLKEQSFEVRQGNLNYATKLSRTCVSLLDALNRHRGKEQQKVTVKHVHVNEGGQAIVGTVNNRREG